MTLKDKIRERMDKCDLVLVYPEGFKTRIIMMLVKTIFPGMRYNPFSPVFVYHGQIYGFEKDENLARILINGDFERVCVIDEKVKWNKRRIRDFWLLMREYGAFLVLLKYIVVGIAGMVINMFFFYFFFRVFAFPDIPSLIASIELSIILTFFMNDYWVFSNRVYSNSVWWRMGAYHFAMLMGVIINVGTYWILSRLGLSYMVADFVGIVFASLWNFYTTNAHVFFAKYQRVK